MIINMSNPISPTTQVDYSFIPSLTASPDDSNLSQNTDTKKNTSATSSSSAIFLLGEDYQDIEAFRAALFEQVPSVHFNKPLKPLVFLTQKTKEQFESFAKEMLKELQDKLVEASSQEDQSSNPAEEAAHRHAQLLAATIVQLQYMEIGDVKLSEFSKAYILGRGAAGDTEIQIGSNNLSSKQLVDILQLHKISSIGDLRFTASQGVDTSVLASFSQAEVAQAEKMANPQGATSLVHNIATEFSSRSVNSLTIFGYHGNNAGLTHSVGEVAELNQHHLRRCGKEGSVQEERRSRLRVGYQLDKIMQTNFADPKSKSEPETMDDELDSTKCIIL